MVRRRQERSRARLSSVSLNSSSSPRRADLCSAVLRISSHRLGGYLEVPSSLHSPLADCLETRRPNSSPLKADLCSGAPQLNHPRVADSLAHNSPPNNNREDRFLVARNNQPSSRVPPSLETPSNPPLDRRHRSLELHSSRLPPGLHYLVILSSNKRDSHYSETPSPHCLVPTPPRRSLSSNHPLWERRSVRIL